MGSLNLPKCERIRVRALQAALKRVAECCVPEIPVYMC